MKNIFLVALLLSAIAFTATGQVRLSDLNTKALIVGTEKIPVSGSGNPAITPNLLRLHIVADSINNGIVTTSPSQNAVFDALALKQGLDADLTAVAGLSPTNDDVMQYKSGAWANRTLAQLRTDLGLSTFVTVYSTILNLTNQPNSEEILGNATFQQSRFRLNATNYTQVRITAYVNTNSASANNPRVYPQYATTFGTAPTWTTIGAGTVASGEAVSLSSSGMITSSWITLPAGAKADVTFRIVQHGGDGAADPQLTFVGLEFR